MVSPSHHDGRSSGSRTGTHSTVPRSALAAPSRCWCIATGLLRICSEAAIARVIHLLTDQIGAMDLETYVGGITTLAAVPITWLLTNLTTARANTNADRVQLQNAADALLVAVVDIRGAVTTNHMLRESRLQRCVTVGMAGVAFASGIARATGSDRRRALVGSGDVIRLLARERHSANLSLERLSPMMSRVAAAAAPLLHHQNSAVSTTAMELMDSAFDVDNPDRLDAAVDAFGQAIRVATAPPRTLWARLRGTRAAS